MLYCLCIYIYVIICVPVCENVYNEYILSIWHIPYDVCEWA